MATLTIHNIDPELKAAALRIIKGHGMTARDTMAAFLSKVVHDHEDEGRCFCCDLEFNEETRNELTLAKSGKGQYTVCKDADDLFKKLGV